MNFFHSGDLGDVIYALPSIRAMGGGDLYLESRPWTAAMTPLRASVLRRLLGEQEYIGKVIHGEPPEGSVDFSTFRKGGLIFGVSLLELQSRWVQSKATTDPWLFSGKDPESKGKVVCHRSPRYNNPYFRWDEIGRVLGDRLLFVGSQDEISGLRKSTGVDAPHFDTSDFFDLARVISGADMFIGNQSSPMSVAVGLGVPFIQETCLWTPDCLFPRENGYYCYDGAIPSLGISAFDPPPDIDRGAVPAGGWVVRSGDTMATFKSHRAATRFLHSMGGYASEDAAAWDVDRQTVARSPNLVRRDSRGEIFSKVAGLVENLYGKEKAGSEGR